MEPNFIHGDFGLISGGSFSGYEGYKSKSCTLALLASSGILCKDKPQRNRRKAVQEYALLHVWHTLLGSEPNGNNLHVESPTPVALDERYRIYMTFASGVTGGQALSGGYVSGLDVDEKRGARLDFAKHMGRLFRIKEREGLAHGDFQQRHVLFDPATDGHKLTVIDVEHAHISPSDTDKEHTKMLKAMRACMGNSPLWQRKVDDAFDQGYAHPIEPDARIHDVIGAVRTSLNLPDFKME